MIAKFIKLFRHKICFITLPRAINIYGPFCTVMDFSLCGIYKMYSILCAFCLYGYFFIDIEIFYIHELTTHTLFFANSNVIAFDKLLFYVICYKEL